MIRRWLLLAAVCFAALSQFVAVPNGEGKLFGHGGIALSVPAILTGWFVSEENSQFGAANYGSTLTYYNRSTGQKWINSGGDWIDKNGTSQGTTSYASSCSGGLSSSCTSPITGAPQTWNMPITQLVQEAVADPNQNLELFLKEMTGNPRYIAPRNTGTPPTILVTYTDTSTDTLACLDNALLSSPESVTSTGTFNIASATLALHFAMPNAAKTVSTAVLTVTNTQQFASTASPKVFRVKDVLYPNGIDGAGVHLGVANSYTQDVGLGTDPSIYFFADGSSFSGMFTEAGDDANIVSSWDLGTSPNTAKYPWSTLGKFHTNTKAQVGVTVLTGTATAGSKIITGLSSTTGILNHFFAYDPTFAKLDIDSKVATVDSSTQVTLDRNALASGSVSIQFIQSAPTIFTTGDVVSGSNTISNIPDTSALATNMWVSSVSANSTNKGGYFPWPSVITVVDAHTVTTQGGSNHAGTATGTGVQLMFARQTPGIEAYGTWPVVVPSTYSNHGYTPLAASSGSAIMYRLEPMMEYIADQEFYFVPTTDGNPASTYAPGQDATGQGVRTPRKTSNLTMDGSTNGFSCTSGSDVITITDPTHGASAGDWVNLPFQVSVCGVLLHDWYPIQTVIDANNYTIKSYGAEWYNFEVGSQITATSNVTKGGVVPTFTTFNGMKSVAVTLPNHVQHPSHFDSFSILGSNFTVGGVTIQGNKTPGTTRNEAGNYIAFSANIASNTFTDVIPIVGTGTNRDIHVTITGTFVATITLQSSTDGTTWSDATTWTVPVSTTFNDGLSSNLFYRIGVKTGDFTSRFGTATAAFFSPNEFGINPQFEWSGGTATSTATVAINSGQAQLKYQPVGTTPWPAGKLPNELYVRWYMMLGSDFIPPDNASCTGGKWTMGTAHRTSVSSNGGACACTRASLKGENHYAAMNGWSARNQDNMGVTPGGPDYQKFMLGTYQYGYDFCQDDFMYGILAALNPGQWYSIEIHTKMNTYDTTGLSAPGSAPHDGMIEAWIDGRKTFSKTDFKWREQPPYDPMVGSSSLLQVIGDLGIKSVWNPSYFGGVCAIAFESAYFVKNVAIGTSYIGPMKM